MPRDIKDLKRARNALWQRYQNTYTQESQSSTQNLSGFHNDGEREAYLLSRFPATYGACCAVFDRFFEYASVNNWSNETFIENLTVLDLGCGPGTASLALCDVLKNKDYPQPSTMTCIDQDDFMLKKSEQALKGHCQHLIIQKKILRHQDNIPKADIVLMSYMLAEVPLQYQKDILTKAFFAADKALILISPGTSALFPQFLKWRQHLIKLGGFIAAPCPHMMDCPHSIDQQSKQPGWCHFKTRIARTREMKTMKNATMSFEDEPYNYLIVLKNPLDSLPSTRIISPPQKRKGHMHIEACTEGKILTQTFSSRMDHYRILKHATWGDVIDV